MKSRPWFLAAAVVASLALFCTMQFKHLGHPLLWQDEAETAMFGVRVLREGYPKIHGVEGVVYGLGAPLAVGSRQEHDAYIGSLWGQYYLAAIGVLLADGREDLYQRTAWLRLPFALTGLVGLAVLFGATCRAFGPGVARPALAASAFLVLCSGSISLILHLREVRYYALSLLLLAIVVTLCLARLRVRPTGYVVSQTVALVLLFHSFYPACVAASAWIVLEEVGAWFAGSPRGTKRGLAVSLAPCVLALVLVTPAVAYFEILAVSGFIADRYEFGLAGFVENLGWIGSYLLRFEMLGPVLVLEVALARGWWRAEAAGEGVDERARRGTSNRLLRLALVYALVGAGNPIFFERYFVPLGPLLTLIFLLDGFALYDRARRLAAAAQRRRWGAVAVAGCVACAAAVTTVRLPEVKGRIREITVPYRGPLDYSIVDLHERHADASRLTVATNYEDAAYMYYLGCRVTGRFAWDDPEFTERPDVIIPRPGNRERLRAYFSGGEFERRVFPVANLRYNNIPELFTGPFVALTHLFEEFGDVPDDMRHQIFERVATDRR